MLNPMNPIMPHTTIDDMRGACAILTLISNPQSEAALAFLVKLAAEKDAAVEAARAAKAERDAAETALDEAHEIRQEIEGNLAAARTEADRKAIELKGREDAVRTREDAVGEREGAHADTVARHAETIDRITDGLTTREATLETAKADYERTVAEFNARKAEFDRHMAPVLAAAKAATV